MADVANNVGSALQAHADKLVSALVECLKDSSVHRDLKPVVITTLGDIALAIMGAFEPYLQMTTMLLLQAANQKPDPNDEEMVDFINELRCAVLEAYSGVLVGFEESQKESLFLPNVQSLLQFLQYLSNPQSCRDSAVILKAVTILGDVARVFGTDGNTRQFLLQPFVMQMLSECSEMGDQGREAASYAHATVLQSTQQQG